MLKYINLFWSHEDYFAWLTTLDREDDMAQSIGPLNVPEPFFMNYIKASNCERC